MAQRGERVSATKSLLDDEPLAPATPTDGTEPLRAVGYCRVSTLAQAEAGHSLDEQERRLREFIGAQGWECVGVYIDPGISGRSVGKRPELQAMLAAAEQGAFQIVVIPSLDRLGRNASDLHLILVRLEQAGVRLRSLRGDVDTSSATGRLLTQIMGSVAEFESNLIGERTSVGKRASVRAGKRNGGPRPYGYTQANGRLTLVASEADVLRRMRAELLAGRSMRAIAADLNRDGITTARGAAWTQGRVSQMFSRKAVIYTGKVRHYDDVYVGDHQPVFTEEEWGEVQTLLAARRARSGNGRGRQPLVHLFAGGMMRCGYCGAAMVPRRTKNSPDRVCERYRCHGQLSGASPECAMPSLAREVIDSAVLDYFQEVGLDVDETRLRIVENAEGAVRETRAALTQAERQRAVADDRLARVKRDYQDERIDADDWREQRDELCAEREAAAAEANRLAARVEEVAGQGALIDSEQELLERIAELRRAVAGTIEDNATIEVMRGALLRLFSGFTLHPFDEPEVPPALPDGWVRSDLYTHHALILGRVAGGLIIEPHPRADMIRDERKETPFPELRRVPLDEGRVQVSVSAR